MHSLNSHANITCTSMPARSCPTMCMSWQVGMTCRSNRWRVCSNVLLRVSSTIAAYTRWKSFATAEAARRALGRLAIGLCISILLLKYTSASHIPGQTPQNQACPPSHGHSSNRTTNATNFFSPGGHAGHRAGVRRWDIDTTAKRSRCGDTVAAHFPHIRCPIGKSGRPTPACRRG